MIFVKFRLNILGIMSKENVLENFDIWNIYPCTFLVIPTLDADV